MSLNLALLGEKPKTKLIGPTRGKTTLTVSDASMAKLTRKQMTDVQLATLDLEKELRSYQDITENRRYLWREEMTGLEQIRTMNMRLLAAALVYINQVLHGDPQNLIPEVFTDEILQPYLDKVLPAGANVRAYKEDLFRYIRAVLTYRATKEERLMELQEQQAQVAPVEEEEDEGPTLYQYQYPYQHQY